MKVVQLFKIYWPDNGGGIATTMKKIADALQDETEQEIIVCHQQKEKKTEEEHYENISVIHCQQIGEIISTPLSLEFLKKIKNDIKRDDIVIYHFPYPLVDIAILFGMIKCKKIVWWHCDVEKRSFLMKPYSWLIKNTLRKADRILVGAQGIIDNSDYLKKYKEKCRIVPFCVDDIFLTEGQKDEKCLNDKEINILFIGRLVWYKGLEVLLEAYSRMEYHEKNLYIIGDGPLEGKIRLLCKKNKIQNVHLCGRVSENEKIKHIRKCDYLVLPSTSKAEAFALVQLEAMAFGKPVINTNLPSGVPEISKTGISGLTVEPDNVEQLAGAMDDLAYNKEKRLEYGINARNIVLEKYTRKIFEDQIKEIINEEKRNGLR